MKASLITCSVLAATLGFSSLASAQDWNGRRDHQRDQRVEQRQGQRFEQRQEQRFEQRQEQRRDWRQDQRRDERVQNWDNSRQHSYRQQPNQVYTQPNHAYSAPRYYANNARLQRGGYLPYEYRSRSYYVNDWNQYPGLYAPPYGHQWMNVGGEFLLVAVASGLIANLLLN